MSRQAHPAFPSLPVTSASYTLPPVPTDITELHNLVSSCNSLKSVQECLIPLLQQVSEGKNQGGTGTSTKERAAKGEDLLAMADTDVYGLDEEMVKTMTAALVYIISARFNRHRYHKAHINDLLALAFRLCAIGDRAQLEMCRSRSANFAWGLLRFAQQLKKPELVFQPLFTLIHRSYSQGVLSGVHPALLETCLLARNYDHALPIINEIYTDIRSAAPSYLDVITFHHHAGMICAATGDYARAVELFSAGVTVPTQAASAIQLACAKRAILCELLVSGRLLHFPKYISGAVNRVIERNAPEYTKLAKAFEAKDWTAVRAAEGKAEFAEVIHGLRNRELLTTKSKDCNMGLLGKVFDSMIRRRILKVKDTFSRLRISDLAKKVGKSGEEGVVDVTAVLDDLVAIGEIRATLSNAPDGSSMVTFLDEDAYSASSQTLSQISNVNHLATWLEHQLSSANMHMGISPAYLKKQASILEVTGGKGSGKNGKMDDFDAMMAAEELGDRGGKGGVGANYGDMGY